MLERPLLAPREVPLGALVYLFAPGESEPAADKDGPLPPLLRLTGFDRRRKFVVRPPQAIVHGADGGPAALQVQTYDVEDWPPGTRFAPVQVFSPQDAPYDTELSIIVGDHCLTCADFNKETEALYARVIRDPDGTFRFCQSMAWRLYGRKALLPEESVLTPVGEIGMAPPLERRSEESFGVA